MSAVATLARPAPSRVSLLARNSRARRGPVAVRALLPGFVPLVARAVTAGVLFYASMNWVWYRGTRKDVEKAISKGESKREERRKMVVWR